MEFEAIAGELYGLLPNEFTSARSLRIREARGAGDRQLAEALSGLRRPTIGAWLANQLTRQRHAQMEELLGLGAAMRQAQELEDGSELRRLSQQRRQMIAALLSEAKQLAKRQNQPVSENSSRELEDTLEAGVADADAADSLRSGRLAVGLDYSGFGPLGSSSSVVPRPSNQAKTRATTVERGVARDETKAAPRSERESRATATGTKHPDSKDELAKLEESLAEAQSAAAAAENEAAAARDLANEVQSERDRLNEKVEDVQQLLRETRQARQDTEQRLTRAQRVEQTAQNEVARATRERDKAEALLHRAQSRTR